MIAPSRSPARARPLTSFPGSSVPPGTSFTTRSVPESFHAIGDSFDPPRAQSPKPQAAKDRTPLRAYRVSSCSPPSTSSRPERSSAAAPSRAMPPVRPLAPRPIRPASSTTTDFLRRFRSVSSSSFRRFESLDRPAERLSLPRMTGYFGPEAQGIARTRIGKKKLSHCSPLLERGQHLKWNFNAHVGCV